MSYHIYKTEGFVLDSVNTGEAHRYISLLTKELGLVKAHARSVREERSKLRYSLQNFSYSSFSLVRGREIWRIVGAHEYYNIYTELAPERQKQIIINRLFSLLRRLLHGEGKNDYLFSSLVSGFNFLKQTQLENDALINSECILVLRILYALGYVGEYKKFEALIRTSEFSADNLPTIAPLRNIAIVEINRALRESQL